MNGDLPEPFGQIHRGKDLGVLQSLDAVFDPRERVDDLVAPLVDFSEVRQESPATALLPLKQNGSGKRAGRRSDKSVGDHLMGLLVDYFSHLGPCSVGRLGDRGLFWVFHVSSILYQGSFAIISVVTREGLFPLVFQ